MRESAGFEPTFAACGWEVGATYSDERSVMNRACAWVSLAAVVLFAAGCAPTMLGNGRLKAEKPPLNSADYGSAELVSNGEHLNIKVTLPPSDMCEGDFKLVETVKSYPLVPGMGAAKLVYQGQWKPDQPAKCIEALQGPGGKDRVVEVYEPSLGSRQINLCLMDPGTFACTKARAYLIKQ